ncbi:MAG: DNA polymerase III subunit alpha [Deltaproteobacteria bacterium]|nr:DNA polymerase III subunit alpha [Deltaproteobacteria bacterium]
MSDFVHLNVHSHYSAGWGMGTVENLCRCAKAQGMERLALTDTNGLYGLIYFIEAAKETGLLPIVGSEIVADGHRAVLLVRNQDGYVNLCRIISARQCHQDFDLIKALKEWREGLIVFSDDVTLLKALKKDSAEDLFVEMSPGYNMASSYAFSRQSGIPPLATNRVYLLGKDQFPLHRVLRAVALNTKLSRLTYDDACREHNVLNTPQAMIDQFPHAPGAILNTMKAAQRCRADWDFNRIVFPCFERMSNQEAYDTLYRATLEGCRGRYGELTREVLDRVEHEMKIIREKNFAHYFLVVADITSKAKRSCGRGSAAASIVSYALGITHVDPIKHHLFFERFLNPGRPDPPDIDVDFAWDEREQILDYVFARYGTRRAAMVANHNTYGARSAIREVAKVFGLTDAEIGRVTGKIGYGWRLKHIWKELANHPRMRGVEFTKPWGEILHAAVQLENHLNHLSVHCGGVVIVPDEIRRYCPVEISASGLQVLQWEKDAVEDAGLVKIDILGNRSLAVIRDALALVEINYGTKIDYANWDPTDDPETVRIFYDGNTFGVFYFESPATRQVLKKVSSGFGFKEYRTLDHFHINVVVTSIIRPASNQSIREWVTRLHGAPWEPPHPFLRPVLEETQGVMVFQEQLSRAAMAMAGFDAAEADTLRKVVSKKHREKKLRDFYARFVKGASERGVRKDIVEEVWAMILGFEGYSFCKPHSASYTLVAYKSAFLRAHYPAEFMASVISNGGGYYSTFGYLSEARRMGLRILPPDINKSEIKYTGKGKEIRVGLMQLKELSQDGLEFLIHERSKHGPFTGLDNFLFRTREHVHLQDVRVLIKAGCFDGIAHGTTRPAILWQALRFFDTPASHASLDLFQSPLPPPFEKGEPGGISPSPYPRSLMLKHEFETLGFLLSIHPLNRYKDILKRLNHLLAKDLHKHVGKHVTMVGWMVTGKTVHTREGDPMKFVSFEDTTGLYEAVFFPKIYDRFCHMLSEMRPYLLKGKVEEDFTAVTLTVHWIGFLAARSLRVYTPTLFLSGT